MTIETIAPQWPAPANVRAVCSTRAGGVSVGPYASLNLATHVGDEPAAVVVNRERLRIALDLPTEPCWLQQTHHATLVEARAYATPPEADASYSRDRHGVCVILSADCLPILLCDRQGTIVLAIHAGWRGLHSEIIGRALEAFNTPRADWLAWIGPGISAAGYAVGADFATQFVAKDPAYAACFETRANTTFADLPALAACQLRAAGVHSIARYAGCTAAESARFFSYRRDGTTGRVASLIWLD